MDLLATFAEVAGSAIPDSAAEDSQSFAKILTNSKAKHNRLPLINHASNGRFSITQGDWKLIMAHGKIKEELFNLADDPAEATNIIANHPVKARQLKKQITDIVLDGRTTSGAPQDNDTGHWTDLTWIEPSDY